MSSEKETFFDRFNENISKLHIKDKTLDISGMGGSCNMFASARGFYDLDQFDIKLLIESLFKCLTPTQKQNLSRQLQDSVM